MIGINRRTLLTTLAAAGLYRGRAFAQAPGPLPSWSDRTRQSIMDFVGRVTREGVERKQRFFARDIGVRAREEPAEARVPFLIFDEEDELGQRAVTSGTGRGRDV